MASYDRRAPSEFQGSRQPPYQYASQTTRGNYPVNPNPGMDAAPYDDELRPLRNDPRNPRIPEQYPVDQTHYPQKHVNYSRQPPRQMAYHVGEPIPAETEPISVYSTEEAFPHVDMREKKGQLGQNTPEGHNPRLSQLDPYPWNKRMKNMKLKEYLSITVWTVLAFICLLLSNVTFAVAVATTWWGKAHIVENEAPWELYGLWQYCTSGNECQEYLQIGVIFHASRAFAVIGIVFNGSALIDLIAYVTVKQLNVRPIGGSVAFFSFAAAGSIIICIVTFVAGWSQFWNQSPDFIYKYIYNLNFSFGLAVGAAGLNLGAGIVALLEVLEINKKIRLLTGQDRR